MNHALHSRGSQQRRPILEAQLISSEDVGRAQPIVVGVVSAHQGIPQSICFCAPLVNFRLGASLYRLPSTPLDPNIDGIHSLFHASPICVIQVYARPVKLSAS
jgi:hypothetical protein